MRSVEQVVTWNWWVDDGDGPKWREFYIDTQVLSDAEQDEFFMLLNGTPVSYPAARRQNADGSSSELFVEDDGTAPSDSFGTLDFTDPAIAKFRDKFIPVAGQRALEPWKHGRLMERVKLQNVDRPLMRLPDGSFAWLANGTPEPIGD